MSFLRSLLACLLALVIFSLIVFFVFLGIIGGLASEKEVVVANNSVLHLKLDGPITEMQREDALAGLPIPGVASGSVGLLQLKQAIAKAKEDDKIKGIFLDCSYTQSGFSTIEEIRQSLIDFRQSGKWVVAYNTTFSEGAYYLATAADQIYMHPEGDLEFNGLTIEVSFYKRLFDKLEIRPQIFRVGEFKSAVEPFMLEKMSPENELQLTELANAINNVMLQKISEARKIDIAKLREISDNMQVRNARIAKELGLIDELYYDDEFRANLSQRLDVKSEEDIKLVKYGKYRKSYSTFSKSQNEIAVLVADGTIMPGEDQGQDQVIAGESFVKEIRKARKNDKVKAIVIRINSPGGEFRASDMMWREIQLASQAKPVIASMSDYAASGGYYMAMACDTIVAQPHTITGSIGIFGMMFDMSSFLGNKLGITFDEVRTGKYGDMYTITRPLTEGERNYWQRNLDEHYDTFTRKAAEGRNMPQSELLKVASGRVWTGAQAKERNLVDIVGGFEDAVRVAAEAAGVADDYRVKYFPQPKTFLEQWLERTEEQATAKAMQKQLGEFYHYYESLQKVKTFQGEQARMPFELRLQ
jgi:signal peptide peptidase SppA, 67K type